MPNWSVFQFLVSKRNHTYYDIPVRQLFSTYPPPLSLFISDTYNETTTSLASVSFVPIRCLLCWSQSTGSDLVFKEKATAWLSRSSKISSQRSILGLDLLIKDTKEHTKSVYLAEIMRQYEAYGKTHEIRFLNARMIRTMDPKNIQAVLGLNAKDFGLQPLREGLAMPLFGRGINTTDGEAWQHSRSLIKPTFSRVEICNLSSLESHVGRLLDLLPQDGSEFDLQPLLSRLVCFSHALPASLRRKLDFITFRM